MEFTIERFHCTSQIFTIHETFSNPSILSSKGFWGWWKTAKRKTSKEKIAEKDKSEKENSECF